MTVYVNHHNLPLSLAVWLATDNYDYNPDPSTISATTLLKNIRQIVLGGRLPLEENKVELGSLVSNRMGSAIHDSIEKAWLTNKETALKALGYPDHIIDRVKLNPDPNTVGSGDIPIYMEQRFHKPVKLLTDKLIISGKFDFVGDGRLEDFKSTKVFTYMKNTNDDKYRLQGSIYRWLAPHIITENEMLIQFIFTDWMESKARAEQSKGYPQKQLEQKRFPLMTVPETDAWIKRKLHEIKKFIDVPEAELPLCSDEDLWRSEPQYKYYRNPDKRTRATKNFTDLAEAYAYQAKNDGQGIVITVPGKAKACKYCSAFPICSQGKKLLDTGEL